MTNCEFTRRRLQISVTDFPGRLSRDPTTDSSSPIQPKKRQLWVCTSSPLEHSLFSMFRQMNWQTRTSILRISGGNERAKFMNNSPPSDRPVAGFKSWRTHSYLDCFGL